MKKLFVLLIAFLVIGIGLSGCSGDKIEKFTDSTGVEWRVLTTDKDGNKLIITEHIHGTKHIEDLGLQGVQYNNKNTYTRLNDSDGLKPALKQWFAKNLSLELKEKHCQWKTWITMFAKIPILSKIHQKNTWRFTMKTSRKDGLQQDQGLRHQKIQYLCCQYLR